MNIGISINGFVMVSYPDTTIKVWDLKGELLADINTNNMGNSHAVVSTCGRFIGASGNALQL